LRPIRYVGDISYSLYLYHYAWIMIPKIYAFTPLSTSSRILQVVGAVACAVVSYHLLENPIRRSKKLDAHPWLSVVIAVVSIGAVWLVAQLCQTYWTL
jgi:peptidoglycan/LPS O-acetylase OafA/YrhL